MIAPMLASLADAPLDDPQLVYEPKYDGIRAIAEITPADGKRGSPVRLWSRLGNEKTAPLRHQPRPGVFAPPVPQSLVYLSTIAGRSIAPREVSKPNE